MLRPYRIYVLVFSGKFVLDVVDVDKRTAGLGSLKKKDPNHEK